MDAKTDWRIRRDSNSKYVGDYFQYSDYNRIKANYDELFKYMNKFVEAKEIPIPTVGGYNEYPTAEMFNILEQNAKTAYTNSEVKLFIDYISKEWFPNQSTPTFEDLNRLENLCLQYYNLYHNNAKNIKTIAFTLGGGDF